MTNNVFDQNPTDPPKDTKSTRLVVATTSYVATGNQDPQPKLLALLDSAIDRKQIVSYRYVGVERKPGPLSVRYEFGFDEKTILTIGELFETAKNIAQDMTQQDAVIHNVQLH